LNTTYQVRDNPRKVEFALLIGVQSPGQEEEKCQELLAELQELCDTFGVKTVHSQVVKIRKPQSKFFVGTGKADEIVALAEEYEADVIIFDDSLTPSQQRNWEALAKKCVIDRQEVILDIFAERAHTREAKLQVALARSEYNLPRLKRMWTHLSRQRGQAGTGHGGKGEGEQQIEIDARLVKTRISRLKKELEEVGRQRDTQRKKRQRKPVPTAAIVGYTNAGKSSLLNMLTNAEVLAEDKLFATLDPTTRRIRISNSQELLLTDTVGLVRKLPHSLIEAFKATLEETLVADFLIEVIDISNREYLEHHQTTKDVLQELGAGDKKIITVFNKIDLVSDKNLITKIKKDFSDPLFISAQTKVGMEEFIARLNQELALEFEQMKLLLPYNRHDLIANIHRNCQILNKKYMDDGEQITVNVPINMVNKLKNFTKESENVFDISQ